ncbi:MAG TPA: MarR family transcriptional regulator [Stellaceae bacterium]|nr:MarR family transcriptional regulator [Stellaceae bacterium]
MRQAQLANFQQLDAVVQVFGLTPSQYIVLCVVKEHREGVSSAALARRLGVTPQSSHEIVAGLERRQLVHRTEDIASRRVLKVALTAAGAALLQKCDKEVEPFERRFFAQFSAEEQAIFRRLLECLIRDSREKAATDTLVGFGTRGTW